ncbi:MAG TPA: gliding motility-associated C-terminal domain-containing protein [Bacteroidia bacterium]|jgi:gliding motility-associated-like protein|nr:gliding motility-associated C-terminal domain-containing protein [Bacteroidia bacterium]
MKKFLLFTFCFLFFTYRSKAQLLFYQDTYKGGVTSDGVSYHGYDYLQPDTINFQLHIPVGSSIRKAYLLSMRVHWYSINEANPLLVNFNNNVISFDSSDIITNKFNCDFSIQSDSLWIVSKEVTNLVLNSGNKLITPNQVNLTGMYPNGQYAYNGFVLVVMYGNLALPLVNAAVFINTQTYNTNMVEYLSGLNPVNNGNDIGLSIWTTDVTSFPSNYTLSYTLGSSLGNFNLGVLDQYLGNSVWKKTLPGSFYYENNILTGLVDDKNSPFIDSTNALANIKTYVANGATSFSLTSIVGNGINGCEDARNGYILAYSSTCPPRSSKDTTMNYTICSGNNIQLNGTSVGSYTWSAANGSLNNYYIPSPVANPTTTTTYIALIDSNGCKHTEHFKVNVYATPKTDSVKTTIGTCGLVAGTATIIAPIGSPTSYTVNNMVQSSPTFTNLVAGTYTFALSNNNGCSYTSPKSFIIKDTNIAQAHFVITPDSGCAPLSIYCLNTSNNVGNVTNAYVWYVNNDSATTQNLNYIYTDTGKFTITLLAYETLRQCSATATQTLLVKYCPPPPPDSINITVPNIFSPNADGINDAWQLIVYNFNYTINNYECLIYDRWGIKVFETNNINTAWDGKTTSGMPSSAGTYYYIIKLTATSSKGVNKQKDFKGYLELVR